MDTKFRNILRSVSVTGKSVEDFSGTHLPSVPLLDELLWAAPDESGTAGSGGRNAAGNQAPDAQENKQQEEASNEADEQKRENTPSGIANPDSPLTGDTGNMEVGQTDLGASGTGAEDPTQGNQSD